MEEEHCPSDQIRKENLLLFLRGVATGMGKRRRRKRKMEAISRRPPLLLLLFMLLIHLAGLCSASVVVGSGDKFDSTNSKNNSAP